MRRIVFDFLTLLCLIAAGIALYQVSSSETPLNLISRFENVIWIAVAVVIAVVRVRLQTRVFKKLSNWWLDSAEWVVITTAANLGLFWLDVMVHPQDDFKTMFAFGFLLFLVPSTIFSTVAYLISRMVFAGITKDNSLP